MQLPVHAEGFGEGLERAKQFLPDVILLDLHMPGLSGLETLKLLVQDVPQTAVVILTVSEDLDELALALRDGACGYLLKSIETDTLASAIRKAAAGHPVIADDMTAKLVASMRAPKSAPVSPPVATADPLTTRERDIMRELARGASNKEIARSLMLAESTVKIHVRNILRKLNLTSRVQVAIYAVGQDAAPATEAA